MGFAEIKGVRSCLWDWSLLGMMLGIRGGREEMPASGLVVAESICAPLLCLEASDLCPPVSCDSVSQGGGKWVPTWHAGGEGRSCPAQLRGGPVPHLL